MPPLTFVLTGGQAERLIGKFPAEAVIGDKGYDSDVLVQVVEERSMQAIISHCSNRSNPRAYHRHIDKELHLVECFFNKIKYYRRIFSHFEKTANHFMAFQHFVAFLIWTR